MQDAKFDKTELDLLMRALAHMRESELARLLEMVETLVQQLKVVSQHNAQSPAAARAARRLMRTWNAEVQRILKAEQTNDAAC